MNIYLVGGAVRDSLLNLPVTEKDWVVVGATPQQLLAQGYQQVGRDFPVFCTRKAAMNMRWPAPNENPAAATPALSAMPPRCDAGTGFTASGSDH